MARTASTGRAEGEYRVIFDRGRLDRVPGVWVQGGKFFPERTRACLSGSNFGGSCLKLGWVGLGLHMEFHAGDQWIITSHVRAIAVEASPLGAPC